MIYSHFATKLYSSENDDINEVILTKMDDSPPFAVLFCCFLGFLPVIHHQQNKLYIHGIKFEMEDMGQFFQKIGIDQCQTKMKNVDFVN